MLSFQREGGMGLLLVTKGAKNGCSEIRFTKDYCTLSCLIKKVGGGSGSSGQSSANWDPERPEHLQPTLGN